MEGFSLRDRVAVVTGGGRSLGLAISRALRGAGACLVIAEVNDQTGPGDTGGPDAAVDGHVLQPDVVRAVHDRRFVLHRASHF